MTRLPVITLYPIWAWSVLHDAKDGECRGWAPPSWLVGRWLLLHAGAGVAGTGTKADIRSRVADWHRKRADLGLSPPARAGISLLDLLPQSALVAAVRISGAHPPGDGPCSRWREPGQWFWAWDRLITLEPALPARGHQGLWWCPDNYQRDIQATFDAAGVHHVA